MQPISLTVNGEKVQAFAEPRTHLADFLREDQRLTGTHLGCEHGVCGACTILIDGAPARSCIAYAVACEGRDVRTIEGFGEDAVMAQLRTAFNREHALQCGFCTPGMLIAARDVVMRVPDADEQRVRIEMSGNLCRCTGYRGIVRAILSVLELRRAGNDSVLEDTLPPPKPKFMPFEVPALLETPAPAPVAPTQNKPGTVIEDEFTVDHPLARVWEIFGDMPAVAGCLPGAEITEHTPTSLKGKVTTKFGPMRASFAGCRCTRARRIRQARRDPRQRHRQPVGLPGKRRHQLPAFRRGRRSHARGRGDRLQPAGAACAVLARRSRQGVRQEDGGRFRRQPECPPGRARGLGARRRVRDDDQRGKRVLALAQELFGSKS